MPKWPPTSRDADKESGVYPASRLPSFLILDVYFLILRFAPPVNLLALDPRLLDACPIKLVRLDGRGVAVECDEARLEAFGDLARATCDLVVFDRLGAEHAFVRYGFWFLTPTGWSSAFAMRRHVSRFHRSLAA